MNLSLKFLKKNVAKEALKGRGLMKALLAFLLFFASSAFCALPLTDYETVAASQSAQVLGPVGGAGDILERVIIVPATTSPGAVQITDGAGSAVTIFAGGASSVASLSPIVVEVHARSTSGAWKLTTGANVSAIGVGQFK
jgi:hypothetical protein